jgi:ADP-dependent NAD(P)H-hydrate dehydratase / NAD(P)H-hydrate epimerase
LIGDVKVSSEFPSQGVLLDIDEMYRADAEAVSLGVSGEQLMENAGAAVAREICKRWSRRRVLVLCGPGNNGGDGFVVARLLKSRGWDVRLALLGEKDALKGDARIHADRWDGGIEALSPDCLVAAELVVDALFGAGLTRNVEGVPAKTLEAIADVPIVSIDTPSGLNGNSGATGVGGGTVARANLTVTFFRRKPGHVLLPGRELCGELIVADIGIPEAVVETIKPQLAVNSPAIWGNEFPWPKQADHKYKRGHAVITGGRHMTGAARMSAVAAQRIGAGMVTVAAPTDAVVVYKICLTTALIYSIRDTAAYIECLSQPRVSSVLVGPGNGTMGTTRERAMAALRTGKPVVLDADALGVFDGSETLLYDSVAGPCVLTPHDGEFAKVFPDIAKAEPPTDKVSRTRAAAKRSGAVVLLKGADTVIAAPDGRAVINVNAPPDLATGGAGDVLSGVITGLMAQGMAPFESACAGAWLHGEAAHEFGSGLVADDLINALPTVLRKLKSKRSASK